MKTTPRWVCLVFVWLTWIPLSGGAAAPWKVVNLPISPNPVLDNYRLYFVSSTDGWVIGGHWWNHPPGQDSFVGYRTIDGGRTWQQLHVPPIRGLFEDQEILAAYRLTSQEGWIGGSERVAHTVDGGTTWELILLNQRIVATPAFNALADRGKLNVYGIHFWNRNEGLALCHVQIFPKRDLIGTVLLSTNDGGDTWQSIQVWGGWLQESGREIQMLPTGEGWMYSPSLYHTLDRGKTWKRADLRDNRVIDNVYFALTGYGAVLLSFPREGESLNIVYSFDKGAAWNPSELLDDVKTLSEYRERTPTHNLIVNAVTVQSDFHGWAVGWGGLILTTEDGSSWESERNPTDRRLCDVQYNGGVVYAIGDGGIILKREADTTEIQPTGMLLSTWGDIKRSILP